MKKGTKKFLLLKTVFGDIVLTSSQGKESLQLKLSFNKKMIN